MSSTSDRWPLVSVIIPVYNSERYLSEAIDSALRQIYPHIEVIAIDDGSTDSSFRILLRYGDSIRVIHQANAGSAKARNIGIEASRGQFIAFLDADDVWHPAKTSIQVEYLMSREDIGLVYNDWLVVRRNADDRLAAFHEQRFLDHDVPIVEGLSGSLYTILLLDCVVHTSSVMVRKSKVVQAGSFDESLRKGQDYDCWMRLSRITGFLKLDAILSIYRIHDEGITKKPAVVNYPAEVVNQAVTRWGRTDPDGRSVSRFAIRKRLSRLWLDFGGLHLRAGSTSAALQAVWKSLGYVPWNVNSWRLCIRTIAVVIGIEPRRARSRGGRIV